MDTLAKDKTLFVGNLDCERSLAIASGMRPGKLTEPVAQAISAAAGVFAAFAHQGDALWTERQLARERLGPWLRDTGVELISGELPQCEKVTAWCWTTELAQWAPVDPSIVAQVNHRFFAYEWARTRGLALTGSSIVDSYKSFLKTMQSWPHPTPWILKAPMSASGRLRLRRTGPMDQEADTRAKRLFSRFGPLLFEPWLDRVRDFGVVGHASAASVTCHEPHEQFVDGNGVFRRARVKPLVSDEITERLKSVAREVGETLVQTGYQGPYGIDAFTYRDSTGAVLLNPICEINARHTFGHLLHFFGVRWRDELGDDPYEIELSRWKKPTATDIPLILPASDEPTCAWIRRLPTD